MTGSIILDSTDFEDAIIKSIWHCVTKKGR